MLTYKIIIEKEAKKFIKTQNSKQQQKLLYAIDLLPCGNDVKKLKGYKNYYRLRINDYRVIYTKDDDIFTIIIINADNRGDIYKRY